MEAEADLVEVDQVAEEDDMEVEEAVVDLGAEEALEDQKEDDLKEENLVLDHHLEVEEALENLVHQTTTQEEMMEENKNGIRVIHQKEEAVLKIDLALHLQEIVLQEVEAEVDVVAMEELTTTETSSQDQALVAEEAQVEEVDNLHHIFQIFKNTINFSVVFFYYFK